MLPLPTITLDTPSLRSYTLRMKLWRLTRLLRHGLKLSTAHASSDFGLTAVVNTPAAISLDSCKSKEPSGVLQLTIHRSTMVLRSLLIGAYSNVCALCCMEPDCRRTYGAKLLTLRCG